MVDADMWQSRRNIHGGKMIRYARNGYPPAGEALAIGLGRVGVPGVGEQL